jgi:hypothetical protein
MLSTNRWCSSSRPRREASASCETNRRADAAPLARQTIRRRLKPVFSADRPLCSDGRSMPWFGGWHRQRSVAPHALVREAGASHEASPNGSFSTRRSSPVTSAPLRVLCGNSPSSSVRRPTRMGGPYLLYLLVIDVGWPRCSGCSPDVPADSSPTYTTPR